jgi:hypothetical protein
MRQADIASRVTFSAGASRARVAGGFTARLRTVAVTLLAVGAATLALATPAALANSWILPPTDVSAAGQDTGEPQVAIAPDGTTTVVWQRDLDGITQAATRPAGSSSFGAIQPLSDPQPLSSGPQVAVAPDGETTVVWGQLVGGTFTIQARIRPAGSSTFGAVQNLATNQGSGVSGSPRVAVAADGATTVTWTGQPDIIRAATRAAGSNTFGPVEDLSVVGENAAAPRVAVAGDGTTTVAWNLTSACSPGPTCFVVQARTRPAGSNTFGPVQGASPTSDAALFPNLAVAADGATTVVWTLTRGCVPSPCEYTSQAATRPAGSGTFGTAQDVSPTESSTQFTNVAVAPDGAATVVWAQLVGGNFITRARTRPAGSTTFGTIEDISEIGTQSAIQVAAAPDGAITVAWEWEDFATGDHTVQAASRPAGASAFGTVTNLSAAGATPARSRLAVAPDGAVTAVWAQFAAGFSRIQAASTAPTTYPLAVQLTGEGKGSVTSSPSGIDCGSSCQALFNLGTKVTLSATAASGSTFTGWAGAGCSGTGGCEVTMSEARSVTATFASTPPSPLGKPKLTLSIRTPKKVDAGKRFQVTVKIGNASSAGASARSVKTCATLPSGLSVINRGSGKVRGRTICWTRSSLAVGGSVIYNTTVRASKSSSGRVRIRGTASASDGSSATVRTTDSSRLLIIPFRRSGIAG